MTTYFAVNVHYNGYDETKDELACKLGRKLGLEFDGGGAGFGIRELFFYAKNKTDGLNAVAEFEKAGLNAKYHAFNC